MLNMHRRGIILCLILPLLYISGCGIVAIEPKDAPAKNDINIIRQDLAAQQQRIDSLLETTKKEIADREQEVRRIEEDFQKGRADVNASFDRIREEIAALRGKLEETEQAAKKANENVSAVKEKSADKKELDNRLLTIQKQLAELGNRLSFLDKKEFDSRLLIIQKQLAELGNRLPTLDEKEFDSRLLSLHKQLTDQGNRLSSLDEKVASLERTGASSTSSMSEDAHKQANLPVQADKQEAKSPKPADLYNEAIMLMKENDYSNALIQFGRFLSIFPDNVLASNAQYWIGEIYYKQKDYERAVLEFNEVLKKYPQSNKAPAALLKQGMAFYELGNKKEARLILEKVMDKYPKTEEAGMAKKVLRGVK